FEIAKPLAALTRAMRELAAGNFDVALPGLNRKDEVGSIATAVSEFKIKAADKARTEADEMLRRRQQDAENQAAAVAERERAAAEQSAVVDALTVGLEKLAEGDLTYRIEAEVVPRYQALKDNFNAT